MSTPADHGYVKCSRCGTQRPLALCEHGSSIRDIGCADQEWCDAEAKRNDPQAKRIAELEAQQRSYTEPVLWPVVRFIPKHAADCKDLNCDRRCMESEAK